MLPAQHREREFAYFAMLDSEQQQLAIGRMARQGMGDYVIASATRLSVEFVRTVIGPRRSRERET